MGWRSSWCFVQNPGKGDNKYTGIYVIHNGKKRQDRSRFGTSQWPPIIWPIVDHLDGQIMFMLQFSKVLNGQCHLETICLDCSQSLTWQPILFLGGNSTRIEQFESLLQYDKEIYRLPTKLPIYLSPMRSGSSKSFKSPKFGSALNSEQLTNFTSIHLTS